MSIEKNLAKLLKEMSPTLQKGAYVFVSTIETHNIPKSAIIFEFKEQEGTTIILKKEKADELRMPYTFVASWVTLNVYSSLEAVGLTAAVSTALSKKNISCNVVAAYYHDHIFVPIKDTKNAMDVLHKISNK